MYWRIRVEVSEVEEYAREVAQAARIEVQREVELGARPALRRHEVEVERAGIVGVPPSPLEVGEAQGVGCCCAGVAADSDSHPQSTPVPSSPVCGHGVPAGE